MNRKTSPKLIKVFKIDPIVGPQIMTIPCDHDVYCKIIGAKLLEGMNASIGQRKFRIWANDLVEWPIISAFNQDFLPVTVGEFIILKRNRRTGREWGLSDGDLRDIKSHLITYYDKGTGKTRFALQADFGMTYVQRHLLDRPSYSSIQFAKFNFKNKVALTPSAIFPKNIMCGKIVER